MHGELDECDEENKQQIHNKILEAKIKFQQIKEEEENKADDQKIEKVDSDGNPLSEDE